MFDLLTMTGTILRGIVLTATAVVWTILLVRLVGLRSFSKMTAFDFVATVAIGSLIAQAGTNESPSGFAQSLAAIGAVFLVQWLLARLRLASPAAARLIRNQPVFLVKNGRFDEAALRETRVSKANVYEKLRSANVNSLSAVTAVVLETTGDISVVQGQVDDDLFQNVRQVEAT